MLEVPTTRIRPINQNSVDGNGDYILYWMVAHRRVRYNFALQRAVHWARELRKPVLILEALRCDYPWASDRLHRFVLDGMIETADALTPSRLCYYPYLERARGEGKGLLAALAERACAAVTDDFPAFFIPQMIEAASSRVPVRLEAVDSNGLLPIRAPDRVFTTAYSFRRYLQKHLLDHLGPMPEPEPLAHLPGVPAARAGIEITRRWPCPEVPRLIRLADNLASFPIDHRVPATATFGGAAAAEKRLHRFVSEKLDSYPHARNHPDENAASGLSPYLHFGHLSAHQVFSAIVDREQWSEAAVSSKADGRRQGWWGMSEAAEAFLDQLITWRELGFNRCANLGDSTGFESLPDWARDTLHQHRHDPRPYHYRLEDFAQARTHDPIWNAAQTQLLKDGTIHNYLRMLWGKKILHWTPSPEEALAVMTELNNKYALDGRDPNSASGICWVLGRYDRAWGPERPIFGKVRFMSSKSTAKKLRLKNFLARCTAT